jgi:hypothetical protein
MVEQPTSVRSQLRAGLDAGNMSSPRLWGTALQFDCQLVKTSSISKSSSADFRVRRQFAGNTLASMFLYGDAGTFTSDIV